MIDAIMLLQPSAILGKDFVLQDDSDGSGPRIIFWNTEKLGPQPTPEFLEPYTVQAEAAAAVHQHKAAIDAERELRLAAGVEWRGKRWYTDGVFQAQITARVAGWNARIIPAIGTKPVRALDGSINNLTFDEHKMLAGALFDYVEGVYGWSWLEKAKL